MNNLSNNDDNGQPNQPQHVDLALPAWMGVGYRASSGWRETQSEPGVGIVSAPRLHLQTVAEMPACARLSAYSWHIWNQAYRRRSLIFILQDVHITGKVEGGRLASPIVHGSAAYNTSTLT